MTTRTLRIVFVSFAMLLAAPVPGKAGAAEEALVRQRRARGYIDEAAATADPLRLLSLAWKISEELEAALRLDPELLDARIDLVRFHVTAPRIVGGRIDEARIQAGELAGRNAGLGHWAAGYLAYRVEKNLPRARRELRASVATTTRRADTVLALTWLGWLSQETQQWQEAFTSWQTIRTIDPRQTEPLYEIGRTSSFCRCERERGSAALQKYLAVKPAPTHAAEARKLLRALAPS
jgi:tetratricopeptide (TPR) repeat protein